MDDTTKTTVYLNSSDYRRLRALAVAQGRSAAELVREAVAIYTRTHESTTLPSSVARGRSGRGDLSERAEELLTGLGQDE